MPTLYHLSDLHFGKRFVPHLGPVLLGEIAALKPDAVVISGDFTLRGRHEEYALAREFLRQIAAPVLTIPGNHDQPLFAPLERLLTPYARYCRYIHPQVDSRLSIDGLFVLGLSDCHPIVGGGFWSFKQRAWIQREMAGAPRDAVKVVASHHQLVWGGKWRPAGFWFPQQALGWLARQGVEVVLNGHTHMPMITQLPGGLVAARAGTATSDRTRQGWGNTYNVLTVDAEHIAVSIQQYDAAADAYVAAQSYRYVRRPDTQ